MRTAGVERAISPDFLRHVVEMLESFRSHPLGFRVAGTPEERRATAFLAREMREMGLRDVLEEPVPVDAWRLREAYVEIARGGRYECASMGGVPQTPRRGVEGDLVFVRRGGRKQLERIDVAGRVVLVDWSDKRLWPFAFGLELGLRGAAAVIVTCGSGGPYFQADQALGTFDAAWHAEAPPLVTIRKEDAASLAGQVGRRVRVVLRAPLARGAEAANVVGRLPGQLAAPLLVGGHHDGWFAGASDDASGVAATLAIARALIEAGVRPRHQIVFMSHTAEEYGIAESAYDWCYGAWYQILVAHREWAARAPFYLNVEGSGVSGVLEVDPPPELAAWTRRVCRGAARDGLLPHGFRLGPPSTWTEVWTFLAAGIPGINVSTFPPDWRRRIYHTQFDTSEAIDFDHLANLTRVYARLLLEADRDPDAILDYGERSQDVRKALAKLPATRSRARLERGLARLARAKRRPVFTALGRGLYGLDVNASAAYPHEQTARDVAALEAALTAYRRGATADAARHAARVGLNSLCADLSAEAFAATHARVRPGAPRRTWADQGRLDPGPDLWAELASLRGEPGARACGAWLERRLEREIDRARRELDRRLVRMASTIEGGRAPLPRVRI